MGDFFILFGNFTTTLVYGVIWNQSITLQNIYKTSTWPQEWNLKSVKEVSAADTRNIYNDIFDNMT